MSPDSAQCVIIVAMRVYVFWLMVLSVKDSLSCDMFDSDSTDPAYGKVFSFVNPAQSLPPGQPLNLWSLIQDST